MAQWDSTQFLASVRRRARMPTATASGSADSDLLAIANEQLLLLAAEVAEKRSELFYAVKDTSTVAGTASYLMPTRAIGASLRTLQMIASDGAVRDLKTMDVDEVPGTDTDDSGSPQWYRIEDRKVVLYPKPDAVETLRMAYLRRPARLVTTAEVGAITSVADLTLECAKPSTILTTTPCDVVSFKPSFQVIAADVTPTAVVASTSVTFSSSSVTLSDLAVGDYICLADESPVLQMPVEFFPVLAQRTANALHRNSGRLDELKAGEVQLAEAMEAAGMSVVPRNQGKAVTLRSPWR